nr:PEPxxWA-CTERM sorting domain-containing protein [Sphingomonas sp.]
MPVIAALKAPGRFRTRAVIGACLVLALAAALAVATVSRSGLGIGLGLGNAVSAVGNAASHGLSTMKTMASMLADRSPGARPEGALASLKLKKQPALHERALPKVRKPESPLAGIVGTPPVPPIEAAPTTPLIGLVAGPPDSVPPGTIVPPGPPGETPPGDVPPVIVPPGTPNTPDVPPVTPPVPEPATWAMMLLGFAMIGWAIRRDRRGAAQAAV